MFLSLKKKNRGVVFFGSEFKSVLRLQHSCSLLSLFCSFSPFSLPKASPLCVVKQPICRRVLLGFGGGKQIKFEQFGYALFIAFEVQLLYASLVQIRSSIAGLFCSSFEVL